MKREITQINNKSWDIIVLGIIFFALPFVLYFDNLMAKESLVGGDGLLGVSNWQFIGNSLKSLQLPLWTPSLAGGKMFMEDITTRVLYPFTLLVVFLPGYLQTYFYFAIHYVIGGVFMYLFISKITDSRRIGIAISIMYIFTVHMGGLRKEHIDLIVAALYVPAILYFMELYGSTQKISKLLIASLFMALQFYGGFLQYVVYSDIFVFFYLINIVAYRKIKPKKCVKDIIVWFISYFLLLAAGIIPTVKLLMTLNKNGSSSLSLEVFTTLSLHPIKLLMSVFPLIFGENVWSGSLPGTENSTSGMDAELIIGVIGFVFLIYGIMQIKNCYSRFFMVSAFVTVVFACCGQSAVLANCFYHIPIINMFRVPSRTLFIFSFCEMVLIAIGLQSIMNKQYSMKVVNIVHGLIAVFFLLVIIWYKMSDMITEKSSLIHIFLKPMIIFGVYLCVFYFLHYFVVKEKIKVIVLLCIAVIGQIIQVWPYWTQAYTTNFEGIYRFEKEISKWTGNDKVWAPEFCTGIDSNQCMKDNVLTLNAYTNFNLPSLWKYLSHTNSASSNSSGLYMQYGDYQRVMKEDNDFLSMMGVRYIVCSSKLNLNDFDCVEEYEVTDNSIIEEENSPIYAGEGYQVAYWPVKIDDIQTFYVELEVASAEDATLYLHGYSDDLAYTDYKYLDIKEGINNYSFYLNIMDNAEVINDDTYFRVVFLTEDNVHINRIEVREAIPLIDNYYSLYTNVDGYYIYENKNYCNIIDVPQRIITLEEEEIEDLYINTEKYDIINTSYICNNERGEWDFSDAQYVIDDIKINGNTISAEIETDSQIFVNMSQTYYNGWRAYIDGVEVELYEVNGIIQGCFVPAGHHTVVFKYRPVSLYIGMIISGIYLFALVLYLFRKDYGLIIKGKN